MTTETTELDVDQIAREAAEDWRRGRYQQDLEGLIAAAIRRAIQEVVMPAERTEQARLINERDEARAVLKEVERNGDFQGASCCPCCWGLMNTHHQGCKLAKVLNA